MYVQVLGSMPAWSFQVGFPVLTVPRHLSRTTNHDGNLYALFITTSVPVAHLLSIRVEICARLHAFILFISLLNKINGSVTSLGKRFTITPLSNRDAGAAAATEFNGTSVTAW